MWINTKSIFEWNSRLKKYVEIHNEGFDYDGEMMLMGQCTGQPNHSSCFPNGICWQGRCHHGGGGSRNYMPNPYLHFVEKTMNYRDGGNTNSAPCKPTSSPIRGESRNGNVTPSRRPQSMNKGGAVKSAARSAPRALRGGSRGAGLIRR